MVCKSDVWISTDLITERVCGWLDFLLQVSRSEGLDRCIVEMNRCKNHIVIRLEKGQTEGV